MERPMQITEYVAFKEGLHEVAAYSEPIYRRINEMESLPTSRSKISDTPINETFLKLAKAVRRFHESERPMSAKNAFAYCAELGRKLEEQLEPGDDQAAMSLIQGVRILETENPELAEDVNWVMDKVDEETEQRRQGFYEKWKRQNP